MGKLPNSLAKKLEELHDGLIDLMPALERIAVVTYDPDTDILSTYVNSTRTGTALAGYDAKLKDIYSLSRIAETGEPRYIANIGQAFSYDRPHSKWLLEQGYTASLTVPLFFTGKFLGFVFFNSSNEEGFSDEQQSNLITYSGIIATSMFEVVAPIRIIQRVASIRDVETSQHILRVAAYSRLIAQALVKKSVVTDEFVHLVFLLAPLHDIGKIAIPDRILLKPGPLTDDEYNFMKTHVQRGVELVTDILTDAYTLPDQQRQMLINIVGHHHEKLDGTGYPLGLIGDEISVEGRILAIADIFDALTTRRPYKDSWEVGDAFAELAHLADDGKLDPELVEIFTKKQVEIEAIMSLFREPVSDRHRKR